MHPGALARATTAAKGSNVTAFLDTSVVNQLLDVCFYVTPDASTLHVAELECGDALLSIINLFRGWKPKLGNLTCRVRGTVDPPVLVALRLLSMPQSTEI